MQILPQKAEAAHFMMTYLNQIAFLLAELSPTQMVDGFSLERGGERSKQAWMGSALKVSEGLRAAKGFCSQEERGQQVWEVTGEKVVKDRFARIDILILIGRLQCGQHPAKPWDAHRNKTQSCPCRIGGVASWSTALRERSHHLASSCSWRGATGCWDQPKPWQGKILVNTVLSENTPSPSLRIPHTEFSREYRWL